MTSNQVLLLSLAALFVILAGLLVAVETAIGRVSRSQVEELTRTKPGRAMQRLRLIVDERARYINVVLFLHTMFSVAAISLLTYVLVEAGGWSPAAGLVAAMITMTLVMFLALGVAPRTLGRQHADRIAVRSGRFAMAAATLLGPLVQLLILLGNALTPGRGYREGPFATQAELREMVDLAEADQVIADDEAAMLHSVFELGDTTVREVMVPRTEMVWIERHRTLRQAMSLALRSGFSRIPVIDDGPDNVVGVFYLKDVANRIFEHQAAGTTEQIESRMRPATFVPDSKRVDALLRDLQSQRVHMAIAVDEYGGTAGLVTIEDVLEEIVGEIDDEYDSARPQIERLGDDEYRLNARLHVEEAAETLGLEIDAEAEGVDSLGGLIAKRLGKVAVPGAVIRLGDWTLTAEQAAGRRNRIATVLAQRESRPTDSRESAAASIVGNQSGRNQ